MQNVSAAVIVKSEKYFIAKRKTGGSLGNKWEFPGGKAEHGETPQECLVRELEEEFDIKIKVKDFIGSHRFFNENKEYELMAYFADIISGEIKLNEHQETRWINLYEFDNYDLAESDKAIVAILKQNSKSKDF